MNSPLGNEPWRVVPLNYVEQVRHALVCLGHVAKLYPEDVNMYPFYSCKLCGRDFSLRHERVAQPLTPCGGKRGG